MLNWKDFWEEKAESLNRGEQVGRVVNGVIMSEDLTQKIAHKIAEQLDLKPSETLLDVCCGNGLLTAQLLQFCQSAIGVDFSEKLINQANEIGLTNVKFIVGDASNFKLNTAFDKAVLYFSFQYFEEDELAKKVLKNLIDHVKPGGKILIGDVTDARKILNFYNSPKKLLSKLKQDLTKTNNMGRFWSPQKLVEMCANLGAEATVLKQENWQPYSHYRFDLIIQKSL